jgi:hypothetical protein
MEETVLSMLDCICIVDRLRPNANPQRSIKAQISDVNTAEGV